MTVIAKPGQMQIGASYTKGLTKALALALAKTLCDMSVRMHITLLRSVSACSRIERIVVSMLTNNLSEYGTSPCDCSVQLRILMCAVLLISQLTPTGCFFVTATTKINLSVCAALLVASGPLPLDTARALLSVRFCWLPVHTAFVQRLRP